MQEMLYCRFWYFLVRKKSPLFDIFSIYVPSKQFEKNQNFTKKSLSNRFYCVFIVFSGGWNPQKWPKKYFFGPPDRFFQKVKKGPIEDGPFLKCSIAARLEHRRPKWPFFTIFDPSGVIFRAFTRPDTIRGVKHTPPSLSDVVCTPWCPQDTVFGPFWPRNRSKSDPHFPLLLREQEKVILVGTFRPFFREN